MNTMHRIYQNASELKAALPSDARFTLVGGCFDLLHIGHVRLLEYAASLEGALVVAVLSDRYISTYKSADRPIIPELQRTEMVASLRCVTAAYVSDESPNCCEALAMLQPTRIVFDETQRGTSKMELRLKHIAHVSPSTIVMYAPRLDGSTLSTGHIICKIRHETPRPA